MVLSYITSIPSYINTVVQAAPGLRRLKLIGRSIGLLGIFVDIGVSLIQSISTLDFTILMRSVALNLIAVDRGLAADITALKAGASGLQFWFHTWGVYSKLWFIFFATTMLAAYLKNAHFGEQVPSYQLYLVVFVLFLTPIQVLGNIISITVEQGKFTLKDLNTLQVWNGLRMTFANADLWLKPVLNVVGGGSGGAAASVSSKAGSGVKTLGGG